MNSLEKVENNFNRTQTYFSNKIFQICRGTKNPELYKSINKHFTQ